MCLDGGGGCEVPAASAATAAGFAHMSSPCEDAPPGADGGGCGGWLRMSLARYSFLMLSLLLAMGAFSVEARRECCWPGRCDSGGSDSWLTRRLQCAAGGGECGLAWLVDVLLGRSSPTGMLCRRNFLCGRYTSLYGCGGCSSARFSSGCCSSTAGAAAAAEGPAGFPAAGADEDEDEEEGGHAFSAFSLFSALFLASSSVEDDLGLEQTLVFVLWDPCEAPALGESIPESLGESSLRTLCFVTVAAAVPVAALGSSAVGAAATRLRDTVVTVAADEGAALAAAAAAAAAAA